MNALPRLPDLSRIMMKNNEILLIQFRFKCRIIKQTVSVYRFGVVLVSTGTLKLEKLSAGRRVRPQIKYNRKQRLRISCSLSAVLVSPVLPIVSGTDVNMMGNDIGKALSQWA